MGDQQEFMDVSRRVIRQNALPTVEFTVGVLSAIVKAFITGASPRLLPLYITLQWPIVLFFTIRGFSRTRHLLYLAEFCWFANAVGWLAVSAEMIHAAGLLDISVNAATRVTAARAFFVLANGPLAFAVLMNKNRLVFHDPVKTSGFFIHFSPALTTWALTWRPDVGAEGLIVQHLFGDAKFFALQTAPPVGSAFSPEAFRDLCLAPLAAYGAWWLIYAGWLLTVGCTLPGNGPGKWGRSSFADAQDTMAKSLGIKGLRAQAVCYLVAHLLSVLVLVAIANCFYWSFRLHSVFMAILLVASVFYGAIDYHKASSRYLEKNLEQALQAAALDKRQN